MKVFTKGGSPTCSFEKSLSDNLTYIILKISSINQHNTAPHYAYLPYLSIENISTRDDHFYLVVSVLLVFWFALIVAAVESTAEYSFSLKLVTVQKQASTSRSTKMIAGSSTSAHYRWARWKKQTVQDVQEKGVVKEMQAFLSWWNYSLVKW